MRILKKTQQQQQHVVKGTKCSNFQQVVKTDTGSAKLPNLNEDRFQSPGDL